MGFRGLLAAMTRGGAAVVLSGTGRDSPRPDFDEPFKPGFLNDGFLGGATTRPAILNLSLQNTISVAPMKTARCRAV
jgi:hypothetical protein